MLLLETPLTHSTFARHHIHSGELGSSLGALPCYTLLGLVSIPTIVGTSFAWEDALVVWEVLAEIEFGPG